MQALDKSVLSGNKLPQFYSYLAQHPMLERDEQKTICGLVAQYYYNSYTASRLAHAENHVELDKVVRALITTSFRFNELDEKVYDVLLAHKYDSYVCVSNECNSGLKTVEDVIYQQLKDGIKPKPYTIRVLIQTLLTEDHLSEYEFLLKMQ